MRTEVRPVVPPPPTHASVHPLQGPTLAVPSASPARRTSLNTMRGSSCRVDDTARMATCGGLMTAVKWLIPYMPKFDTLKVPPWYSWGASLFVRALVASVCAGWRGRVRGPREILPPARRNGRAAVCVAYLHGLGDVDEAEALDVADDGRDQAILQRNRKRHVHRGLLLRSGLSTPQASKGARREHEQGAPVVNWA